MLIREEMLKSGERAGQIWDDSSAEAKTNFIGQVRAEFIRVHSVVPPDLESTAFSDQTAAVIRAVSDPSNWADDLEFEKSWIEAFKEVRVSQGSASNNAQEIQPNESVQGESDKQPVTSSPSKATRSSAVKKEKKEESKVDKVDKPKPKRARRVM